MAYRHLRGHALAFGPCGKRADRETSTRRASNLASRSALQQKQQSLPQYGCSVFSSLCYPWWHQFRSNRYRRRTGPLQRLVFAPPYPFSTGLNSPNSVLYTLNGPSKPAIRPYIFIIVGTVHIALAFTLPRLLLRVDLAVTAVPSGTIGAFLQFVLG